MTHLSILKSGSLAHEKLSNM